MSRHSSIPVFLVVTAAYWGSLYTYVPILSPYSQSLGASLGMVGLIVASYGFSQLILRVPTGLLSDGIGRRRPFIWAGLAASILSAWGMALARAPWQLLLYRGLSGVAASMWVAFTVLFASYADKQSSARSMGILMCCTSVSQLLASFAGGWLADQWGWTAPFAAAVGLAAAGVVLTFFVAEPAVQRSQSVTLGSLLSVGKSRLLLTASLLAALNQYLTFVTVFGFTPSYAAEVLGASKAQLGLLTLVANIPNAVASLLGGTWLAKRLGEKQLVVGGFLLAGLATIAIPFTNSIGQLNLVQALGGVGRGVVFPVLMGMSIQSVAPEKKATAMGFFQSIYALGMTGGPAISGLLGDAMGMRGIFVSAGLVGLLAGVAAWVAYARVIDSERPTHTSTHAA